MAKWWIGAVIVAIVAIIAVVYILHSKNPAGTLSVEFRMGGSQKLHVLQAIQMGAACIMFLAAYMRKIVKIDFQAAGSKDSLQMLQGLLQNNNSYAQQGASFINRLNQLLGNTLFSQYRYATSSAQFMNDPAGRWMMVWIFLLMLAPAVCVLSQFLREPYARRTCLWASVGSTLILCLTPIVMNHLVAQFAANHQVSVAAIQPAFAVGGGAFWAGLCSIIVLGISIYREVKQDRFE
ncbi:MAG: cytochrome C5 [Lactobacillus sp.]|jgi:hypothetical protein|nr:cytochrome C5 [Lactobacillus sp.]MCH3905616.1 cytochrome C5 [Lactobacillus sp.]MCI1330492.1 cytochrome C5 [Lactobacillus sp.]MCI1466363.1 cytochrome C5 [Lactobacillus sp.]MCI1527669.1 cytochrome C5 [Lactobacillus sp.]